MSLLVVWLVSPMTSSWYSRRSSFLRLTDWLLSGSLQTRQNNPTITASITYEHKWEFGSDNTWTGICKKFEHEKQRQLSSFCKFSCMFTHSNVETIQRKCKEFQCPVLFLLSSGGDPGSVVVGFVETCDGGSAVLPCRPPNGDDLAVEGVSLKRQRVHGPVEVLYNSKLHHGSASPSSSSSQFSAEKVRLSSAPGPGGITFNLTLQQLQPDDSGLYSCQLLLRGRPDSSTSLGRHVFFLSVQGGSQRGLDGCWWLDGCYSDWPPPYTNLMSGSSWINRFPPSLFCHRVSDRKSSSALECLHVGCTNRTSTGDDH